VSWRDREWAQFNDEERKQFYGASATASTRERRSQGWLRRGPSLRVFVWGLVAVAALVVSAFVYKTRSHAVSSVAAPPVVYSGPVVSRNGYAFACTSELFDTDKWLCAEWRALVPGQVAQSAVDTGESCGYRHADQASGRWSCDEVTPPRDVVPMPLPPVPQLAPAPADPGPLA